MIVAEISGNHGGSLAHCLELVRMGKGVADQIKFQRFNPYALAHQRLGLQSTTAALGYVPSLERLIDLYHKTVTPVHWWPSIKYELNGFPWSCSVFSREDLAVMQAVGCRSFKIASFESNNFNLIRACMDTGDPLVISINSFTKNPELVASTAKDATILWATPYIGCRMNTEIAAMEKLRSLHPKWGLSDHTLDNTLSRTAIDMGATMIERHISLPRLDTPDNPFSTTAERLAELRHGAFVPQ